MRKALHRFGKFYSRVMMNNIGIFIFVGILSVVFGEQGWIPNEDIYAISQFVYLYAIPIIIAYTSANQMKSADAHNGLPGDGQTGGALAVMAEAGLLAADFKTGILGAMLLGPCCGFIWKRGLEPMIKRVNTSLEMLFRNLLTAAAGCALAGVSFYFLAPVLLLLDGFLMEWITFFVEHRLIVLLGFVIEPAKVFFLNNSIHHGILLPLGMQQAAEHGESILFLLETNPGPGLGVLAALYVKCKNKRKEYAAGMFAHFIGGIHEVYFPQVIENIWLLIALIAGGTVGNLYFSVMQVGAVTAISPGSILTMLFVCMESNAAGALVGVILSAVTSMAAAICILSLQKRRKEKKESVEEESLLQERKMIERVGFVCDAGVGSSAMGAALLRRKLKELSVSGVEVFAYAVDQIPEDVDLFICQKNFKDMLMKECGNKEIRTMESLLNAQELFDIAMEIKQGRGEGA